MEDFKIYNGLDIILQPQTPTRLEDIDELMKKEQPDLSDSQYETDTASMINYTTYQVIS